MANTSCPFIHWWWPCTCRKSPAPSKKVHRQPVVEWKLQFGLVRLRINPRRCEAWCELDEVTREKLSNTWQRSDRTSVGRFCDRRELKPNRKFDSVRGLVDRNFRTVRPRFSIQFSISSPVIIRNRRIEPKFGLLNLSNREVLHSVRRNFLDGMLRSGCEFRKLIPKRSLKRSIETESERNSVDHFRKSHSLVQW